MTRLTRKSRGIATALSLGVAMATFGSVAQAATCSYSISNEWSTGYTGTITIDNTDSSALNGWNVNWQYNTNRITSSWNANVSGSNPYSASDLGWNGNISPGQVVEFGFQVDKNGGSAETPSVNGTVCSSSGTGTSSSEPPSSANDTSSISSSLAAGQQCNWYGTLYSLCTSTQSGWGWENNASCIAATTCSSQPDPYGIVGGGDPVPSSSSSSSVQPSSSSLPWSSSYSSSVVPSSSSSSVTSSSSSSSVTSSSASSVDWSERADNPFVGANWYVDQNWAANATASGGAAIADVSTAVWMDRIGAIVATEPGQLGLRDHLDAALDQGANLFQVVIYDLPNRDCHALASNGELKMAEDGFNRYVNEYIAPIVEILSDPAYSSIRIIAIIEPDSLPNLVTNLSTPACMEATGPGGYVDGTRHTLNELGKLPNVYSYIDIGHSGWLGWDDNFQEATVLIADAIKGADKGVDSIAGFVSNTSGYTPLREPFLDSLVSSTIGGGGNQVRSADFYEWNMHFSEISFVQAWRDRMISLGFPSTIGMLIDTSRNGWGGSERPTAVSTSTELNTFVDQSRVDRRLHRGNWCNQAGGIGERPQIAPEPGIDAYVWVKPPGESDGVAEAGIIDPNDPAKGFDGFCDPTFTTVNGAGTGALPGAPHAGRWFPEAFQILLENAYPPLD
jgi:cellulose 1,4-beta-cellobiosidase